MSYPDIIPVITEHIQKPRQYREKKEKHLFPLDLLSTFPDHRRFNVYGLDGLLSHSFSQTLNLALEWWTKNRTFYESIWVFPLDYAVSGEIVNLETGECRKFQI